MRNKSLLLLVTLLALGQSVWAYDFSAVAPSGQTLYYSIDDSIVVVTYPGYVYSNPYSGYTRPIGDLTIPDSVTFGGNTYPVTSIGNNAFRNCTGLTSVTIPNSVTSIGSDAFSFCTGLTLVNYTGTLAQWCNISFTGVRSNPVSYANSLNINGNPVTNLVIPNDVTSIGNYAFAYYTGLTSVTIGNSVTSIGIETFSFCSGLTSVTIGNSVTSIGSSAFLCCSGLTSVTIPDSVTNIGEGAFSGCAGLTSVTIGNSVTSISQSAFSGCSGLTSVTIPSSVTSIGAYAFRNCMGLTSVTIGNSVIIIGIDAFDHCWGLTSVTIPSSVTSIGGSAFEYCTGLTSVTFNADSCVTMGTSISPVFRGCTNLATLTIGNNVRIIPNDAFKGFTGLTSVTIGNSVISIGDYAFSDCTGLTSMQFLSQVPPQLGTDVFEGIPRDIPVYIPCGRLAYYASQLPYFTNYIEQLYEFSAASSDESMGTVQVLTAPSCTDHNAVLSAVPADGYRFDHWSTGSTDNPYTLTVTSDITVIAYFVSDGGGTEGIDEVEVNAVKLYQRDGRIVVEGAEGQRVTVFDAVGRVMVSSTPTTTSLQEDSWHDGTVRFEVPTTGVYLVKVGDTPARRIVVVR